MKESGDDMFGITLVIDEDEITPPLRWRDRDEAVAFAEREVAEERAVGYWVFTWED